MTTKLTLSERIKARQIEKKKLAGHITVDYPEAKGLSTSAIIKYKKALDAYPDLAEMGNTKLILLAYDFRQEQARSYHTEHTTELANARSDIQLGGYKHGEIPEDLPALSFEKECVVCHENRKVVSICPDCWQKIRKYLELKAAKHNRNGWVGWGYECSLDLQPLIKLLASSEQQNKSLRSRGKAGKEKAKKVVLKRDQWTTKPPPQILTSLLQNCKNR